MFAIFLTYNTNSYNALYKGAAFFANIYLFKCALNVNKFIRFEASQVRYFFVKTSWTCTGKKNDIECENDGLTTCEVRARLKVASACQERACAIVLVSDDDVCGKRVVVVVDDSATDILKMALR